MGNDLTDAEKSVLRRALIGSFRRGFGTPRPQQEDAPPPQRRQSRFEPSTAEEVNDAIDESNRAADRLGVPRTWWRVG